MIEEDLIKDEIFDLSYITDKLTFSGAAALTDQQLLSVVLGRGVPKDSHYAKAKQLLERYGSLDEVLHAPLSDLRGASSINLKCCAEIGRRIKQVDSEIVSIENSADAEAVVRELLKGAVGEEFWVICLNRSLKVISKRCIFRGGVSSSIVDIKILMKYILDNLSSAIIIAHNHPSGSIEPSEEDISITKDIVRALNLFDIICFDHIIVAQDALFSFRRNKTIVI